MADLVVDFIQNDQNQPYPEVEFHGAIVPWPDQDFAGVEGPVFAGYCRAFERFFPIE